MPIKSGSLKKKINFVIFYGYQPNNQLGKGRLGPKKRIRPTLMSLSLINVIIINSLSLSNLGKQVLQRTTLKKGKSILVLVDGDTNEHFGIV